MKLPFLPSNRVTKFSREWFMEHVQNDKMTNICKSCAQKSHLLYICVDMVSVVFYNLIVGQTSTLGQSEASSIVRSSLYEKGLDKK